MHIAQLFPFSPALLVAAADVITAAPYLMQSPVPRDVDSLVSKLASKSSSIEDKISSKSDSILSRLVGDPTGNAAPSVTPTTDSAINVVTGNIVSTSTMAEITPNAAYATGIPMMAGGLVGAGLAVVALL